MDKLPGYFLIAVVFLFLGYFWRFAQDVKNTDTIKRAYTVQLATALENETATFFVGDIKFTPTQYQGLWLVEKK